MATVAEAPARSLLQRREALQLANDIRSRRAKLKRDLKAGRQSLRPLIAEPPAWLESAKVFDLLLAAPKQGRVKALKALNTCRVSPSKTIGGLSERQRRELLSLLPDSTRLVSRGRPPAPLAQRTDALKRANSIRLDRAMLARRIGFGEISVPDVLRDPPGFLATMPVGELVIVQPRWGEGRMRKLLRSVLIGELKPVGALTERQRLLVADRMESGR